MALVSQVGDSALFSKSNGKPLDGDRKEGTLSGLCFIKAISDCWADSVGEVI